MITYTVRLVDHVRSLIAELGESPTDICATLHNKGIRGVRASADKCVLSRYLSQRLGAVIYTMHGGVTVSITINADGGYPTHIKFTESNLSLFVLNFDLGRYPRLLERCSICSLQH